MTTCNICGKQFDTSQGLGGHVHKAHSITIREYRIKYNLLRLCQSCGIELSKKCAGDYCNHCRNRTGVNNPFYGKHHTKESIEQAKQKLRIISIEKWKDPEYRAKVIRGVSKPRSKQFKKEQSIRTKKWFEDNPEQRTIRSINMKKTWEEGKITPHQTRFNRSKQEIELFQTVKLVCPDAEEGKTIKYDNGWFFPDIFIPSLNLIIEYNGDYWHGNPVVYSASHTVHHNQTAQMIWEADQKRQTILEQLGYWFYVVWESGREEATSRLLVFLDGLDWDSCAV